MKVCTAIALMLMLLGGSALSATLEKIRSLEDPRFENEHAVMTVGQDGRVYLTGRTGNPGFLLHMRPDGSDRRSGDVVYALRNVTANRNGVIATANAHFSRSLNLYDQSLEQLAVSRAFTSGDGYGGWAAPGRVEAAPSGDFYALDQYVHRVVRLNDRARVTNIYPIPEIPLLQSMRVAEGAGQFYLLGRNQLYVVGFDGELKWERPVRTNAITVDEEGTVYLLSPFGSSIQRISHDNQDLEEIALHLGEFAPSREYSANGLDLHEGTFYIQRRHPTELFLTVDAKTGEMVRRVQSEHQRLAAEFPDDPWIAGTRIPFLIRYDRDTAIKTDPVWRVWASVFGDNDWRDLRWDGAEIQVPDDAAGLLHVRVVASAEPSSDPALRLDGVVQVHAPEHAGTVSAWTPDNRIGFRRGERVPLTLSLRSSHDAPINVTVSLLGPNDFNETLAETAMTPGQTVDVEISAERTRRMAAGRYRVVPQADGLTGVAQPLRFGRFEGKPPPFRISVGGDYVNNNSVAGTWDFADEAERLRVRAEAMHYNQYVNRNFAGRYPLHFGGAETRFFRQLQEQLTDDPHGIDPAKAAFGFAHLHALGLYGGLGTREWLITVNMDAGLPLGTGHDRRSNEEFQENARTYATALKDFPAFAGFNWNQNWWIPRPNWWVDKQQEEAFRKAFDHALETGEWAPILDEVGDMHIQWQLDAQELLNGAFREVDTERPTAAAGAYRRPEIYAPVNFSNVDEVSLHYQAEQITTPNWTAHAPDFYRVAGKPRWMHPELHNEDGTGEHLLSMGWLAIMRGTDGYGTHRLFRDDLRPETDPRSSYYGARSVMRVMNQWLDNYGPWLTQLENRDRVAIAISKRQVKIDSFHLRGGGVGARYFSRLFEAYQSFLHTDSPATFLYAEDMDHGGLDGIDALIVVSQEVEPGPELRRILDEAQRRNIPVFIDGNSRASLFEHAQPLGVTFDRLDETHGMNNDLAWWEYPEIFVEHAAALKPVLEQTLSPAAVRETGHPEILVSQRAQDDVRCIWMVNNAHVPIEPGLLWRVTPALTTRLPVAYHIEVNLQPGEAVYEMFDQRLVRATERPRFLERLTSSAPSITETLTGTLQGGEARLFVVLPGEVRAPDVKVNGTLAPGGTVTWEARVAGIQGPLPLRVELRDGEGRLIQDRATVTGTGVLTIPDNVVEPVSLTVRELVTGQQTRWPEQSVATVRQPCLFGGARLRDVAVLGDGRSALVNAMGWGANAFLVDLQDGKLTRQVKVGDYHAFAPIAMEKSFLVQGYDLTSAEGYHSYHVDTDGQVHRRIAHPGIPLRKTPWAFPFNMAAPRNGHVAATDGSWFATAGNIGLAVWNREGNLVWTLGGAEEPRKMLRIAGWGNQLLVADHNQVSAYPATGGRNGQRPDPDWTLVLPEPDPVLGMVVEPASGRVAVWTEHKGGRLYLLRDGALTTTIPGAIGAVALSPEGRVVVAEGPRLHLYEADGGLRWTARGMSEYFFPVFSPDGAHIAVSSSYGALRIYSVDHGAWSLDLDEGAVSRPVWLEDGDLLTVNWLGQITRRGVDGTVRWQTSVIPEPQGIPGDGDHEQAARAPTSRWTPWTRSLIESEGDPLLSTDNATASLVYLRTAQATRRPVERRIHPEHPISRLFDGDLTPPETPWMKWRDVLMADSGWRNSYYLIVDVFRRQLRVEAVRFVEDPEHPQSWLRDMRMEVWNEEEERWDFAAYLTSDAPDHTHRLPTPAEGARFRFSAADSSLRGWPLGNLRLAEVQFYGEELGASHPDVQAGRPVAVLFDERELTTLGGMPNDHNPYTVGDAFSGNLFLKHHGVGMYFPANVPPFRNALAGWDFVIEEDPEPGAYRWLQFAVKALEPGVAAASLRVGPGWGGGQRGTEFQVGVSETGNHLIHNSTVVRVLDDVPDEWTVVRVDLWDAIRQWNTEETDVFRIRDMVLATQGGAVGFDQVLLGRTEEDLKNMDKTRVACMGDSITFGTGTENRDTQSYPAVLQEKLGSDYVVRNFGVPGRTMLKEPEDPHTVSYWASKQLEEALAFEPDVIVLMLGTNDSWKDTNWQHKQTFVQDYHAMLDRLAALPSKPRIVVGIPPPGFEDRPELLRNQQELATLIRQIGEQRGVEVIDMYEPFTVHSDWFPDGCHPNAEGAAAIAQKVYRQLKQ